MSKLQNIEQKESLERLVAFCLDNECALRISHGGIPMCPLLTDLEIPCEYVSKVKLEYNNLGKHQHYFCKYEMKHRK
jgi:hypothetical protein